MKTAIIYYSSHHGNTKKLLDAIAANNTVTLLDASLPIDEELSEYDVIGFASGIYFGKYHESLISAAKEKLPEGKKVFFIHTGSSPREEHNVAIKSITDGKGCACLGTFFCKGFDTYGPFKLIGGICKNHPDSGDLENALSFFKSMISQ